MLILVTQRKPSYGIGPDSAGGRDRLGYFGINIIIVGMKLGR